MPRVSAILAVCGSSRIRFLIWAIPASSGFFIGVRLPRKDGKRPLPDPSLLGSRRARIVVPPRLLRRDGVDGAARGGAALAVAARCGAGLRAVRRGRGALLLPVVDRGVRPGGAVAAVQGRGALH